MEDPDDEENLPPASDSRGSRSGSVLMAQAPKERFNITTEKGIMTEFEEVPAWCLASQFSHLLPPYLSCSFAFAR